MPFVQKHIISIGGCKLHTYLGLGLSLEFDTGKEGL